MEYVLEHVFQSNGIELTPDYRVRRTPIDCMRAYFCDARHFLRPKNCLTQLNSKALLFLGICWFFTSAMVV